MAHCFDETQLRLSNDRFGNRGLAYLDPDFFGSQIGVLSSYKLLRKKHVIFTAQHEITMKILNQSRNLLSITHVIYAPNENETTKFSRDVYELVKFAIPTENNWSDHISSFKRANAPSFLDLMKVERDFSSSIIKVYPV